MTDRPSDDPTESQLAEASGPPRPRTERRGSVERLGGRRGSDRRSAVGVNDDAKDKDKDDAKGEDRDDQDKDRDDKDKGKEDEKDGDEKDGDKKDGDKKDKPSPFKKPWVRIVLAIVVALLLVALIVWLVHYVTHGRYIQSTNDAYVKADKVAVTATVAALVKHIAIVDNQFVNAGDLLLELDARTNTAKVQQYAAQAVQSRAEAEQYRSLILAQEATVAQYAAEARGAEVQRDYYGGEVKRYVPLVTAGAEKDEQLAQLRENRDKTAQDVTQYRSQELSARRQIASLKAQVAQADAKEQQAIAQEKQSGVDLDNSTIRASVAGRVGDRQVFPGTYVNTGTQMMTIIPIEAIYVEANFKETQLRLMRVGQPATIRVDALGGAKLSGTIESFQPATGAEFAVLPAQNATGNFTKIVQRVPVRIKLDAGPEARRVLIPGLSVDVDVDTIGDKDDIERLKKEQKDREDRDQQRREQEVERDRDRREPGPGR